MRGRRIALHLDYVFSRLASTRGVVAATAFGVLACGILVPFDASGFVAPVVGAVCGSLYSLCKQGGVIYALTGSWLFIFVDAVLKIVWHEEFFLLPKFGVYLCYWGIPASVVAGYVAWWTLSFLFRWSSSGRAPPEAQSRETG